MFPNINIIAIIIIIYVYFSQFSISARNCSFINFNVIQIISFLYGVFPSLNSAWIFCTINMKKKKHLFLGMWRKLMYNLILMKKNNFSQPLIVIFHLKLLMDIFVFVLTNLFTRKKEKRTRIQCISAFSSIFF